VFDGGNYVYWCVDNVGVRLRGFIWWTVLEYQDCLEKVTFSAEPRQDTKKFHWKAGFPVRGFLSFAV
jgi:hypothetical protein